MFVRQSLVSPSCVSCIVGSPSPSHSLKQYISKQKIGVGAPFNTQKSHMKHFLINQGFCGTLVGGDLPNSSDVMLWESARGSCQIKGLNTSINKLCNGWSVWAFDLIWTSVIDICFCLWSSSNTVNLMWTGYWGIFRRYCANFIYVHISCEHCRQPNEYQDVILQTEKEPKPSQPFCILTINKVWI